MWNNKRREDEYTPKAAPTPLVAPEPKKEAVPLSTTPLRTAEHETSRGAASIGKSVTIKGQIFSREDLIVDGEIEGAIELNEHRLTVGPNGRVRAGIKAREIVVLGTIDGNVEALDKIDIRKDAKLVGDIKTARIIIEDGAYRYREAGGAQGVAAASPNGYRRGWLARIRAAGAAFEQCGKINQVSRRAGHLVT
jgi:cytoskeletal protein CcmA (bactofilin family)